MKVKFNADFATVTATTASKAKFVKEVQATVLGNLLKKYFSLYSR